jgi:transglutaminase-like putative cysteine protease
MTYTGEVRDSINELRLCPRSNGCQVVEEMTVTVRPAAAVHRHVDAFGNEVAWFQVEDAHRALVVEAEAVVRVASRPPLPRAVRWEATRDPALRDALAEYLMPSALVHWPEAVDYFAQGLEVDGIDDVALWLRRVERAVNESIRYEKGATDVDTTVERVVRAGRGVCQDMAHLFIALCRRRGVPARYVSGWLHMTGRGEPAESHAWCEAWIPGTGWTEFDPTHPEPDLSHFVRLGVGRDYMDVPPFRGTYVGAPTERMTVTVELRELAAP